MFPCSSRFGVAYSWLQGRLNRHEVGEARWDTVRKVALWTALHCWWKFPIKLLAIWGHAVSWSGRFATLQKRFSILEWALGHRTSSSSRILSLWLWLTSTHVAQINLSGMFPVDDALVTQRSQRNTMALTLSSLLPDSWLAWEMDASETYSELTGLG